MPRLIDTMDSLILGPTMEPLDLEEVKKQRRFSSNTIDTLFDTWIAAARQSFEGDTGLQLMTATWEYWLDAFPWQPYIEIPHPPLQQIISVNFDDTAGVEQTMDPGIYDVRAPASGGASRGVVALKPGQAWPQANYSYMPVRIRYVAGFGDAPGAVDELIKHALMMLVGAYHKFGEEVNEARANILVLPLGASDILTSYSSMAMPKLPKPMYSPWDAAYRYGPNGYGWNTIWR